VTLNTTTLTLLFTLLKLGNFLLSLQSIIISVIVFLAFKPALEGRAIVNLQMSNTFAAFQDINAAIKNNNFTVKLSFLIKLLLYFAHSVVRDTFLHALQLPPFDIHELLRYLVIREIFFIFVAFLQKIN
jgi:hypothetical protein